MKGHLLWKSGLESSVSTGDSVRAHYFHQFNHQHANDCRHYCPAEITLSLMIKIDSILMAVFGLCSKQAKMSVLDVLRDNNAVCFTGTYST